MALLHVGEDVEGTVVTVTADYESGDTKAWGTITKRDLLASIVKVDIDSYEGDEDSFHLTAEERQACRVALDMKGE